MFGKFFVLLHLGKNTFVCAADILKMSVKHSVPVTSRLAVQRLRMTVCLWSSRFLC